MQKFKVLVKKVNAPLIEGQLTDMGRIIKITNSHITRYHLSNAEKNNNLCYFEHELQAIELVIKEMPSIDSPSYLELSSIFEGEFINIEYNKALEHYSSYISTLKQYALTKEFENFLISDKSNTQVNGRVLILDLDFKLICKSGFQNCLDSCKTCAQNDFKQVICCQNLIAEINKDKPEVMFFTGHIGMNSQGMLHIRDYPAAVCSNCKHIFSATFDITKDEFLKLKTLLTL